MPRTRRRGLSVVSGTLFTLAVAVSAVFAVRSTGEPVHEISLGDGGVWVTSGATGMWGRVDRGANQLGTVLPGGGSAPQPSGGVPDAIPRADVLQDGRLVVGVTSEGALVPIDPTTGLAGEGRGQVPDVTSQSGERVYRGSVVDMRGGTIAMIEPQTGRIWAQRLDPDGAGDLSAMTPTSPSLASVDQGPSAIAVDVDGNVKAVSATTGTVIDIPAEGEGFGEPETQTLDLGGRGVDISAVGDRWVVLDASDGQVWVEGQDDPQQVDGAPEGGVLYAALQVPGVEADTVAVSTDVQVTSVATNGSGSSRRGIDFGAPSKELSIKTLHVARPVVNGPCLLGSRSSSSTISYQVVCREETLPATQIGLQGNPNRRNPAVLRLNRGQVLVNDLDTGRVFDLSLDGQDLRIDTWPTADQLTTLQSRSS